MANSANVEASRKPRPEASLLKSISAAHPMGLAGLWRSFFDHRSLILQMARRDIEARYRGSVAGLAWTLLNPMIMLSVYTFVFGFVLRGAGGDRSLRGLTQFAIYIFSGLIVFNFFSECVGRAPELVLRNANYVKKVVFPLETLAWVAVGSAFFNAMMSFLVLCVFFSLAMKTLHLSAFLLPLVLIPFVLVTAGWTWFFASLGVYLRDVAQTIALLMMFLMFMCPIFYDSADLPGWMRRYFYLNPATFPVQQFHSMFISGGLPDWRGLAFYSAAAFLTAWAGYFWFQKTRKGFADVL